MNFNDPKLYENLKLDNDSDVKKDLIRTLIFMALCHTIVIDTRKNAYSASSPDELALVNAAKEFGVVFKEIDADNNYILEIDGESKKYKLLDICEFNSTRKRMSAIYRTPNKEIVLMCKGADSIIAERLHSYSKSSDIYSLNTEFVDKVADEGLRTLFLAEKVLEEDEFEEWYARKKLAKNVI